MTHFPDGQVESALQQLLDRLVHRERSTGRSSILILRESGMPSSVRAQDGVRTFVPEDFTDEEVLKMVV